MKQFLKIFFPTFFLSLFLLYEGYFALFKHQIFKEDFSVTKFKFHEVKNEIQNGLPLLIGDCTLMNDVDPRLLSFKTYNLAIPCSGPFEFNYLLKQIDIENKKPPFIIFSSHIKKLTNQVNCFDEMFLSFNFLNWNELWEVYNSPGIVKYFKKTSSNEVLLEMLKYSLNFHSNQTNFLRKFQSNEKIKSKDEIYNLIKQNKGYYISYFPEGFPFENPEDSYQNSFKMDEFEQFYFEKFMNKLNSLNVPIYIIHPPYSETYKKLLGENYIKSINLYFNELNKKYSNIKYIEEMMFLPNKYYFDAAHVTPEGTKIFTSWLDEKVSKLETQKTLAK